MLQKRQSTFLEAFSLAVTGEKLSSMNVMFKKRR